MTFDASGLTGHPDHQCVSRWASLAKDLSGSTAALYHTALTHEQYKAFQVADEQLNIFFNIDRPVTCDCEDCQCCFDLDDELYDLKIEALRAMPSQTEALLEGFGHELRQALGREAFIRSDA